MGKPEIPFQLHLDEAFEEMLWDDKDILLIEGDIPKNKLKISRKRLEKILSSKAPVELRRAVDREILRRLRSLKNSLESLPATGKKPKSDVKRRRNGNIPAGKVNHSKALLAQEGKDKEMAYLNFVESGKSEKTKFLEQRRIKKKVQEVPQVTSVKEVEPLIGIAKLLACLYPESKVEEYSLSWKNLQEKARKLKPEVLEFSENIKAYSHSESEVLKEKVRAMGFAMQIFYDAYVVWSAVPWRERIEKKHVDNVQPFYLVALEAFQELEEVFLQAKRSRKSLTHKKENRNYYR